MSSCSNPKQMVTTGDQQIQTETETLDDPPNVSELVLLVDFKEADQEKPVESKTQIELGQLSDETCIQDDITKVTSDAGSESDNELACDKEIFGDLLTKIKAFVRKSEQEKIEKTILIDECQIFHDLFDLVEKHEKTLTDKDRSILRRGLKQFLDATDRFNVDNISRTDVSYAKEVFYMFFNLINLAVIQNYLKNVQVFDDLKISYRWCIDRILYVMAYISDRNGLALNDLQRPLNCIELLSLMLNYVKTDLKSSDLTVRPSPDDASFTRDCILNVIWVYADKTVMVPDLIEAGCLEIATNGLAMISETVGTDPHLQTQLVSIVHNVSRHDDGIKHLNALKAIDLVKVFQSINKDAPLNTLCCMALALLSTPEEIKNDRKRMNNVLDTLFQIVYNASLSSDYRNSKCHISEPLIVLVKLFNDDRTLDYVMEHSLVDLHTPSSVEFFINLLIEYHSRVSNDDPCRQATCTALVNILWSISFQDRYKQKLKGADAKFKELIQNLSKEPKEKTASDQYVPQYIENIQKAAESLLYNIDESINPATKQIDDSSTISNINQKPLIMFSYSHKNIDVCRQLYNEIVKRGYDIWIDYNFIKTGDQWEQIAVGMRQANLILCLMSEDYFKSNSCRQEAMFALERLKPQKKTIIPVYLEKPEVPDWFDIRSIDLKYVRFHDQNQLESKALLALIDMIEHSLLQTVSRMDLNIDPPVLPVHYESKPIPMTKVNQPTSNSTVTLPVHYDQPAQTKSIVTKSQNQNISSQSGSVQ